MRALMAVALLFPVASWAAADQSLAVHPLTVVGVAAPEAEEFTTSFASELARLDLDLADGAAVRMFVDKKGGSCGGDEACLAEMAASVGAASALWVTLAPYSPKLILSAKVIKRDGSVARSVMGLEFEKSARTPTEQDVRGAFKKLFDTLRLSSPELVSLVEDPPDTANTNTNTNANTPPPAVTEATRSVRSTIGPGLTATGVGALVLGGIFGLQAQSTWNDFEAVYADGAFGAGDRAELVTLRQRGQSQQTTALISAGIGAALTGVGLFLFLSDDAPDAKPSAKLYVSPNGAALAGTF